MERTLVLVRHGQSEWNLKKPVHRLGRPGLTELGISEARAAGRRLKGLGFHFDKAFTSILSVPSTTLQLILQELGRATAYGARQGLNERHYGNLTGLNKSDPPCGGARSRCTSGVAPNDIAPPGGESLKDTLARVLPYYIARFSPRC